MLEKKEFDQSKKKNRFPDRSFVEFVMTCDDDLCYFR